MELQKLWNALNILFTIILNTNKCLGDYDKLQSTSSVYDVLVLPLGHTQRNQSISVYKTYTIVLRDKLL